MGIAVTGLLGRNRASLVTNLKLHALSFKTLDVFPCSRFDFHASHGTCPYTIGQHSPSWPGRPNGTRVRHPLVQWWYRPLSLQWSHYLTSTLELVAIRKNGKEWSLLGSLPKIESRVECVPSCWSTNIERLVCVSHNCCCRSCCRRSMTS
jgi:hypothetical protein